MDGLFDEIRLYLAFHNARLCPQRPAPIERVWQAALRPLALRRCRSCGGPIAVDRDIQALGPLLAARLCLGCYLREAA